ncbi:MAG: ATP-binding domain-containing protein, partial [Campylobacterota bacterium]|nr:ATP-binding domain-containing protein [Campylobacterota bacterium]
TNSDAKLEIFYNHDEFIEDFTTPNDWYKNDKVLASFKNSDVDYYNKLIRNKYWEAHNTFNPDTLIKGDTIIFQSAHVVNDKVIHQNSETAELSEAIKTTLTTKSNHTLHYWQCKNIKNNEPFNVLDPQSMGLYKMLLNKQAQKAKKSKNYQEKQKEWKIFFAFKEFFVDVKYRFASTIHKLQGSTYDTVYIDLISLAQSFEYTKDKDLFYRLIYVSLTRAAKHIKILLPQNDSYIHYEKQRDMLSSMDFDF